MFMTPGYSPTRMEIKLLLINVTSGGGVFMGQVDPCKLPPFSVITDFSSHVPNHRSSFSCWSPP